MILNPSERPYVKYAGNGVDTVAMAYTQAHPRAGRTNIYYAAYRAGALRRADGSVISTMANLPIAPGEGEQVYDWETSGKAWVHDVALDGAGRPVIVYASFPTDGDHRYRYARWDGTGWVDREFARGGGSMSVDPAEPNYSGGLSLDHDDPSTVYLSRQVGGRFEAEVRTTPDGGATWSSRPLTSGSALHNYRPVSPRGQRGDDHSVVWMHGAYPSYSSYQTGLRTPVLARDIADPATAAWEPGRLDVFALVPGGRMVGHKWFKGGRWSGPEGLGTGPDRTRLAGLAVTSWGAGRLDLFATDAASHSLAQLFFDGRWHGPVRQDFNTTSVQVDPNPRLAPIPVSERARLAD